MARDDLKLGESTFLNTLSRFSKVPASEDIARYPNWKTPLCHAVSRSCHAPEPPLASRAASGVSNWYRWDSNREPFDAESRALPLS